MVRWITLVVVSLFLVSCAPSTTIVPEQASPTTRPTYSEPLQPPQGQFEVVSWFDDPEPEHGSRVMLYGSLIKSGVTLGGMMMEATWPDENQARGVPNCRVQVIYGSGVCIIETADLPKGVYIPITLKFEYQGKTYQGQTGFTAR
jgi:hypothetical protein